MNLFLDLRQCFGLRYRLTCIVFELLALVLFALLLPAIARADKQPGLAHGIVSNYVGPLDQSSGARQWIRPKPESSVLGCVAGTPPASCVWGNAAFRFYKLSELGPDALVNVCKAAIEPGPFAPPDRPDVDPACGDPCGCGDAKDQKGNVLKSALQLVDDSSTFSASVIQGVAPLTTVLSWDIVGVTTCTASGSWTGDKPVKGTQTITGLSANAAYTLTCKAGADLPGSAAVSWEAPTQNADGSALTNIAGYRIQYGNDPQSLTQVIDVHDPAARAYKVMDLGAGYTWFFTATVYRTDGAESARSGQVSTSIKGSPGRTVTKLVNVQVTAPPTIPNPPTGLRVSEQTAYELRLQTDDLRLAAIGTVPLRTQCDGSSRVLARLVGSEQTLEVNRVARELVQAVELPSSAYAQCATQ